MVCSGSSDPVGRMSDLGRRSLESHNLHGRRTGIFICQIRSVTGAWQLAEGWQLPKGVSRRTERGEKTKKSWRHKKSISAPKKISYLWRLRCLHKAPAEAETHLFSWKIKEQAKTTATRAKPKAQPKPIPKTSPRTEGKLHKPETYKLGLKLRWINRSWDDCSTAENMDPVPSRPERTDALQRPRARAEASSEPFSLPAIAGR